MKLDSDSFLAEYFMPHQIQWIKAEELIHAQGKQAIALAEKSVRIGWTYADAFKNVRKRLWFKDRDYLFATKDYPSALEYIRQCYKFAEIFKLTNSIVLHGEESIGVNQLDSQGRPSGVIEQVKIGIIKFDNGSRIIAFSSNPQAMAVHGGDVGLDEFAKHPNAKLLWETAQGRVALGHDLAVWSAHDGEDTQFNEFAQEARIGAGPWNIYFKVTMPDALRLGLVDVINRSRGTCLTKDQFLADCRARSRQEEIFQQAYMCNPLGAATNHIVDWSAIERCRADYAIERLHLEADQVHAHFGDFSRSREKERHAQIHEFLRRSFPSLLGRPLPSDGRGIKGEGSQGSSRSTQHVLRLGFDVAASGQGDLAVFYLDEPKGSELWLRALLTARTEDWDFLKTVLFFFLEEFPSLQAAGDESGLGRQICWEAANNFSSRFSKVNFGSQKHDLGFALMNQLSGSEKRFPKDQQDIAADYFALRKMFAGTKWVFTEGRNSSNPVSHCDIAWAGALASHAHTKRQSGIGAYVLMEDGSIFDGKSYRFPGGVEVSREQYLLHSNDPRIRHPLKY
jgi:phage FluMu gp28-like protein